LGFLATSLTKHRRNGIGPHRRRAAHEGRSYTDRSLPSALFWTALGRRVLRTLPVAAWCCYTPGMTKVVEAIYSHGVLEPLEALELPDKQRVRLIVQPIDGTPASDREAAMRRLREGIASMDFRSTGPYPTRDELHDRV